MQMRTKVLVLYATCMLLGVITGVVGSLFQLAIAKGDEWLTVLFKQLAAWGIPVPIASALLSMLFVFIAWWMVKHIAPEASGSGVQEIEGALLHKRQVLWRRLLPVKFIGGVLAIVAKMVVGREGPTIQMGGNLGEMLGDKLAITRRRRDSLIASGAAAGLATAFNAPLAGVLFVIEEMRNQFNYNFTNFKMVAITCVMASIVVQCIIGTAPAIPMSVFSQPDLSTLWLFFVFGIIIGFSGLIFNIILMRGLTLRDKLSYQAQRRYVLLVAALVGVIAYYHPPMVGGGYEIIAKSLTLSPTLDMLGLMVLVRFILTMLCYSTGVPGGIFAPLLALGTLLGLLVFQLFSMLSMDLGIQPGMFAVAGMGALFSASVRAPITGIVLVVEMTQNYSLILPLMVSCLTSTTVVQLAKNQPIYTQLLRRTLKS